MGNLNAQTFDYQNYTLKSTTDSASILLSLFEQNMELKQTHFLQSLSGTHTHYQLQYNGFDIAYAMVRMHRLYSGKTVINYPKLAFETEIALHPNHAKQAYEISQQLTVNSDEVLHFSSVYWYTEATLIAAYKFEIEGPISHKEFIYSTDNKLLFFNDLNSNSKPDSLITVNVFIPDPISAAQTYYGGDFQDYNDSNVAALNAQLFSDSIALRWDSLSQVYALESDYCKALDFSEPTIAPPNSDSSDFKFKRGDDGFEFVNAFYHLNAQAQWVNALGFSGLLKQVAFDASGQVFDQSSFISSNTNPRLAFGIGGVDDAEDADVIIHEYGHAIAYFAAPATNVGAERNAIDEGICDFFAYCHSKKYTDFEDEKLFNWDGQNEYWPGRTIPRFKTYPSDLENEKYADGLIFTSALKNIADHIGCDATSQLLIESLHYYHENMLLPDAGKLLLAADTMINEAANADLIYVALCNKGLYEGCEDTLISGLPIHRPYLGNTEHYFAQNAPIYLYPNKTEATAYALYTLNGQLIKHETFNDSSQVYYKISIPKEAPKTSILVVATNEGNFGFKLLKAE